MTAHPPSASPVGVGGDVPKQPWSFKRLVRLLFLLDDKVDQRTYFTAGVLLMALKYLLDGSIYAYARGHFLTPWEFFSPLSSWRAIPSQDTAPLAGWQNATDLDILSLVGIFSLPFMWVMISMSVRRAADAGKSPWIGTLTLVPFINLFVMLILSFLPSVESSTWNSITNTQTNLADTADGRGLKSAMVGIGMSIVFCAVMMLLSVYVIESYGVVLFMLTPFLAGAISSYHYNKNHIQPTMKSIGVAVTSITIGCAALLLFALEGLICILMAYPLVAAAGALGGVIGRSIAMRGGGAMAPRTVGMMLLTLPFFAAAENNAVAPMIQEVQTVVEIDAPPDAVWPRVVAFSELAPPEEWFFQAGVAYPIRARIEGSGVGAIRYCEFSTGPFVEPITRWEEPNRLSFDVVKQPQPMHEWSPYENIAPPHLDGYLESKRGEFRLIALDGGKRTRLEGSTWYTLDLYPSTYWRPFAESLLHSIHTRVLTHIKEETEDAIKAKPSSHPAQ